MAPHSSTLAWKIPWMEEPGGLPSTGSWRVGHNWETSLSLFTFMHWRRKWQPTPVSLPGESQGRGSLVGCRLQGRRVGHDWSDLAAASAVCLCKSARHKTEIISIFASEEWFYPYKCDFNLFLGNKLLTKENFWLSLLMKSQITTEIVITETLRKKQ